MKTVGFNITFKDMEIILDALSYYNMELRTDFRRSNTLQYTTNDIDILYESLENAGDYDE